MPSKLFVILLVFGSIAVNVNADYQIYVIDSPINSYAIQEHLPLPATCQLGTTVSVTACRGEYEPASFVVETDSELENVFVTVGQLTGESGAIPSSAVDVRVVQSCWLRVTDFPGRMNMVLLHDPNLLVIDHEELEYPFTQSMSFTRTPIDTDTLQSANVASRQQFWLTVHVPDDALAGTYNGTISITATNAPAQTLTLELTVPNFDLLEPDFEYSLYYATSYYNDLIRLNEYKNMVAHGCKNPSMYGSVEIEGDGVTLDFTYFANELSLREQAGMEASGPLYLVSSGPINVGTTGLSTAELTQLIAWVAETVAWIRQRGYSDVYFHGSDEATGAGLNAQRPTWEAAHAGGGKIFTSNFGNFFPYVGDLLDLAIITHPSGNPIDVSSTQNGIQADPFLVNIPTLPAVLDPIDWILDPYTHNEFNPPDYPVLIQNIHNNGFKVFTYMDCLAGGYGGVPDVQRRLRGLGLYKANLDGTMTWSHNGFNYAPNIAPGPITWLNMHSFVLRGAEAPFDTLPWEAYREGYDDARYLATLQDAMAQAAAAGVRLSLVASTQTWLDNLDTAINLDDWRAEMIARIEQLLPRPEGDFHWDLTVNWKDFVLFAEAWQQGVGPIEGGASFTDTYEDDSEIWDSTGAVVPTLRYGQKTAKLLSDGNFNYITHRFDRTASSTLPLVVDVNVNTFIQVYNPGQEYTAIWYSFDGQQWTLLGEAATVNTTMWLSFEGIEMPSNENSFYLRIGGPTLAGDWPTLAWIFETDVTFIGGGGADASFDLYSDRWIGWKDLEIMVQNWLETML